MATEGEDAVNSVDADPTRRPADADHVTRHSRDVSDASRFILSKSGSDSGDVVLDEDSRARRRKSLFERRGANALTARPSRSSRGAVPPEETVPILKRESAYSERKVSRGVVGGVIGGDHHGQSSREDLVLNAYNSAHSSAPSYDRDGVDYGTKGCSFSRSGDVLHSGRGCSSRSGTTYSCSRDHSSGGTSRDGGGVVNVGGAYSWSGGYDGTGGLAYHASRNSRESRRSRVTTSRLSSRRQYGVADRYSSYDALQPYSGDGGWRRESGAGVQRGGGGQYRVSYNDRQDSRGLAHGRVGTSSSRCYDSYDYAGGSRRESPPSDRYFAGNGRRSRGVPPPASHSYGGPGPPLSRNSRHASGYPPADGEPGGMFSNQEVVLSEGVFLQPAGARTIDCCRVDVDQHRAGFRRGPSHAFEQQSDERRSDVASRRFDEECGRSEQERHDDHGFDENQQRSDEEEKSPELLCAVLPEDWSSGKTAHCRNRGWDRGRGVVGFSGFSALRA